MVNFRPLKDYMLFLTAKLIKKYGIKGPFLDAGGGKGDVSLFLIKKNFNGKMIDFSKEAVKQAKINLKEYKDKIKIMKGNIKKENSKYNFILLWDVIEHVKDDEVLIKKCYDNLNNGGYILVSFVTKRKEWRKDDASYGHIKRYEISDIKSILSDFKILEIWDYTFPVFWMMRRIYTNFIKEPKERNKLKLTKHSSLEVSYFKFFNKYLSSRIIWITFWGICYIFKSYNLGHQSLVLARKEEA